MAGPGKHTVIWLDADGGGIRLWNFDIEKHDPKLEHKTELTRWVLPVLRDGGSVRVVGLTSTKGSPVYNKALSQRRADAVVAELRRQLGAAPRVLAATGLGEETAAVVGGEPDEKENPEWRAVTVYYARRAKPNLKDVIEDLRREIESSDDDRKSRYLCLLSKLEKGADDRVILWEDIAPDPKVPAPWAIRRKAPGLPTVSQEWLYQRIKTWKDVEVQPARQSMVGPGRFVTSMRKAMIDPIEMDLVMFRGMHDLIVETHDSLDKWANWPAGGSSSMPREYRAIKEWMRIKESQFSVLNCVVSSGI